MGVNKDPKLSGISGSSTYQQIGEYWDTHSLNDHWDETTEVEFDVQATRRHRIAVDPDVYEQIEAEAELRGVVPEKLANILLAERLGELSSR